MFLQIGKLERKLAELHATDVKALNRAHQSLCQHVDALELESTVQRIPQIKFTHSDCLVSKQALYAPLLHVEGSQPTKACQCWQSRECRRGCRTSEQI